MRIAAARAARAQRTARTSSASSAPMAPAAPPHMLRQHFTVDSRIIQISPLSELPTPGESTVEATAAVPSAVGADKRKTTSDFTVWSIGPMQFGGTAGADHYDPDTPALNEASAATAASRAVLYVLPGGFVKPILPRNWEFIAQLAEADLHVEVPLYGLLPNHGAAHGIPLIQQCYLQLVKQHGAENVTVIADSAGGGLALGALAGLEFTQSTLEHDLGYAPPKALILNAPWVDLDLTNPRIPEFEPRDPVLNPTQLRRQGALWATPFPTDHPLLSPLFLKQQPTAGEVHIFCGDRDLSLPDCRALAETFPDAQLHEKPGAIHMFHLLNAPESKAARRQMINLAVC